MSLNSVKSFLALILAFLFSCSGINTAFAQHNILSKSDMVKVDFKILAANKIKLRSKDATLLPAYNNLIQEADKALKYEPVTVMQKTAFPPSGDKHDYMSIGPYWWPDPKKPNGLPYKRRDGEVNPEVKDYPDKENMPKLVDRVYTLTLAYYYSGNEKYAAHASKLLQVWFLDTATRMNPNLNFGQAVKGVTTGRAEGLIDTRQFIYVVDAIELLQPSKYWTPKNQLGMKQWFGHFLSWMNTSKIGMDEMDAKNNHGVWFDAQSLSYAIFVDSIDLAKDIIDRAEYRLDQQANAEGFFPLEMDRTTALHYSVFIMNAFNVIAQSAEKLNINFWTLETHSGKSYKKCLDALLPYISQRKEWTGQQIKPFDFHDGYPLLLRAHQKFNCIDCIGDVKKMESDNFGQSLINLL